MRDTKYQIIRGPKVMDTIFTLIEHNLPFTQIAEIVNTSSAYKAIEFLMMNKRIYKSTKGALVSYVLK